MAQLDDLICFSHERWGHEPGRIHELMTRAARHRRVFFVEELTFGGDSPRLRIEASEHGVIVVRPTLPPGTDNLAIPRLLREMLKALLRRQGVERYVLWFCTPMAMAYARDLEPVAVVYDHASDLPETDETVAGLTAYHAQLLAAADVVVGEASSSSWDVAWSSIADQLEAAALPPSDVEMVESAAVC